MPYSESCKYNDSPRLIMPISHSVRPRPSPRGGYHFCSLRAHLINYRAHTVTANLSLITVTAHANGNANDMIGYGVISIQRYIFKTI